MTDKTEHKTTVQIRTADRHASCSACPENIGVREIVLGSMQARLCPACLKALSHLIALELR